MNYGLQWKMAHTSLGEESDKILIISSVSLSRASVKITVTFYSAKVEEEAMVGSKSSLTFSQLTCPILSEAIFSTSNSNSNSSNNNKYLISFVGYGSR